MPRQNQEYIEFLRLHFKSVHVSALIEHIDAIELELKISKEDEQEAVRKYGEAELNIVRLTENVAQLHAAWLELEKQVPKKVALPEEKADALKWSFMNHGTNAGVIHRYTSDSYMGVNTDALRSIPFDTLLVALVNGYTVEKTKEDRLREGVKEIVDKWWDSPQNPTYIKANLTQSVTDFVTKFNAEN